MEGFFSKSEVQDKSKGKGRSLSCFSCGLGRGPKSPKMKPYGKFKKHIMVIGTAPGRLDDNKGKPWQGEEGDLLERIFEKYGIDLFKDCLSLNAVNCRPPNDTAPNAHEINCCRSIKVLQAIDEYNPNIIICVGSAPLHSLVAHRWSKGLGDMDRWRGWHIPDQDYKAWVCPIFDPAYVISEGRKEIRTVWELDIKNALGLIDKKLPRYKTPKVHFIDNLKPLNKIEQGLISFDYEATGLKPQANGQRIICGAVAYDEDNAYAFEIPKKKKDRAPLIDLLQNQNVDKIAANIKYEDHWSLIRLGVKVNNWIFDTMQAAHVHDNRPYVTNLKFQAYVRLGMNEYDADVSPYLKAKEKGGNEINRIYELLKRPGGMRTLQKYCGYDAIAELRLAKVQMKEMNYNWLPF